MNDEIIQTFIKHPHIFGHYIGYTDLIDIHSEWIIDGWIRKDTDSMQAHRNSYKTTALLIVGAIWYLIFFDPCATALMIRKAENDARKVVGAIKSHFESIEVLSVVHYLYKVDSLKTDTWSSASIKIAINNKRAPEGNIDAKGTTAAVTGSHYDFIFPDDIITLKDRVSHAEREWIKDFVRELRNIKKESGKIHFSGTPWHKLDAWSIIPTPKVYPIGTVPIKGYLPEQLPDKIKELKLGTTTSLYTANYELKHVSDENAIFPEPIYADWTSEGFSKINAWLDTAYSGKNNTALSMIGKKGDKHYARGWVWPGHVVDLYKEIVFLLNYHKCGTLFVETNADQGSSARDLSGLYANVTGRREKMNKHNKIVSYGKQNFHKLLFAYDCQLEYISQILDYQEGIEPDDAPDSLSSLLREMGFSGSFQFVAIGPDGRM